MKSQLKKQHLLAVKDKMQSFKGAEENKHNNKDLK